MKRHLLLLSSMVVSTACSSEQPQSHSGRKLKLETIQHDYATTYVYREVEDPAPPKAKPR